MIAHHEQVLQRWGARLTLIAAWGGVIALFGTAVLGTLIYIGANKPSTEVWPRVSGNVLCWAGADSKVIKCGDVEYVRK